METVSTDLVDNLRTMAQIIATLFVALAIKWHRIPRPLVQRFGSLITFLASFILALDLAALSDAGPLRFAIQFALWLNLATVLLMLAFLGSAFLSSS